MQLQTRIFLSLNLIMDELKRFKTLSASKQSFYLTGTFYN